MSDGRYLIFYTFEDEPAPFVDEENHDGKASAKQPDAKPEAEDERSV